MNDVKQVVVNNYATKYNTSRITKYIDYHFPRLFYCFSIFDNIKLGNIERFNLIL